MVTKSKRRTVPHPHKSKASKVADLMAGSFVTSWTDGGIFVAYAVYLIYKKNTM